MYLKSPHATTLTCCFKKKKVILNNLIPNDTLSHISQLSYFMVFMSVQLHLLQRVRIPETHPDS